MTSFNRGNQQISNVYYFTVDDHYALALGATLIEGRWFNHSDDADSHHPLIINETLKEKVFGNAPAAGQLVGGEDTKEADKQRIIGVVADLKVNGDYRPAEPSMYARVDTSDIPLGNRLIQVTPDVDAAFEGRLHKILSNSMRHSDISIQHLTNMRASINTQALTPVIIFGIIAVFLVVNVAFGLFGVLWYNISRRKAEIGLRRAVGASGASVSTQLWAETLILATFALILGTFFAVQFPLLHVFDLPTGVYIVALIFAILFIYALVTICSLYPGRQAAGILPAVALHED
jgi:putative ABC transport system permease protein